MLPVNEMRGAVRRISTARRSSLISHRCGTLYTTTFVPSNLVSENPPKRSLKP